MSRQCIENFQIKKSNKYEYVETAEKAIAGPGRHRYLAWKIEEKQKK
jgi:hypothetical protein